MDEPQKSGLQFRHHIDTSEAGRQLGQRLASELVSGRRVVWLVSGGSNIDFSLIAAESISADSSEQLTILLCDERYGLPGHTDSNWQQLQSAGFMSVSNLSKASFIPVLQAGLNLEDTAQAYNQQVSTLFDSADIIIGQLGIGSDGHIAGILPGSVVANQPSADVGTDSLVAAYDGGVHQRITMTPAALLHINAAYCFAYGEAKRPALDQLASQDVAISDQPAQLLKQLPEAIVFRD